MQLRLLLALTVLLCTSSDALAFCRSTTSKREPRTCDECVTDGFPLAWDHASIRYVFNRRGFPGLDDTTLRSTFDEAFRTWEDVPCEDQAIGFDVRAEPGTTPLEKRPREEQFAVNVFGHMAAEDWPDDPFAFAVTTVRFDRISGRILGADTWFNGGIGDFTVCPEQACPDDGASVDLLNVATHEAGHFLGLAHTSVEGATMSCQAGLTDTDKRSLEADDHAGLCAAYPPELAFSGDYIEGTWMPLRRVERSSCALSERPPLGFSFGTAALVIAALGLCRRRARRSRRPALNSRSGRSPIRWAARSTSELLSPTEGVGSRSSPRTAARARSG